MSEQIELCGEKHTFNSKIRCELQKGHEGMHEAEEKGVTVGIVLRW